MRCIITNEDKRFIVDSLDNVMNDTELLTLESKLKTLGEDLSSRFILDDDRSVGALADIINEWIPAAREKLQGYSKMMFS